MEYDGEVFLGIHRVFQMNFTSSCTLDWDLTALDIARATFFFCLQGPVVEKTISLKPWISGKSRNKILSIRLRMLEFGSH